MRHDDVIRVLGPIDLLTAHGPRSVGSRNARRLLGALVIGAGRLVSADRLQWVVWGDAPPRSAVNALQTYIARLRHVLGRDAIERADHSYRLTAERHQIDAVHFEDLLARATDLREQPSPALDTCREALTLWRGDPFGDFVDDEPFRLEATRLAELRVSATELALGCELALGHHDIVAAELECAVEEHPYREHLWYLLIESLARDDRRGEALRTCQRLREALAAIGLEPGSELSRLEEWILGVAPAPHAASHPSPAMRSVLGPSSDGGNR